MVDYGELERRIFEKTYSSDERIHIVGAGGDLMCANAVRTGSSRINRA